MKKFLLPLFISLVLAITAQAAPLKVTFIDPGKSDEAYWQMVCGIMKSAATQLGMDLEVIHAERDHLKQIQIAEDIAKRAQKPDYVICVNEKLVAPQTIAPLDKAGIKTMLILNDLYDEQKAKSGTPRTTYGNWIGTIIPDNIKAGRLIADELHAVAQKQFGAKDDMVAINGLLATPAAAERQEGLQAFLKANPGVNSEQIVNTDWTEAVGYEKAKGLLVRYPNLNTFWCGNDPVALGSIKALKEAGKQPGKDILVAGLNWSPDAINLVKSGEMVATIGGHFMVGAWAIVLIYDYANNKDFASISKEMRIPGFSAINKSNVAAYQKKLGDQKWSVIDFTAFSRAKNPGLSAYDFGLDKVLASIK